jgi:hypothetical protein
MLNDMERFLGFAGAHHPGRQAEGGRRGGLGWNIPKGGDCEASERRDWGFVSGWGLRKLLIWRWLYYRSIMNVPFSLCTAFGCYEA